MGGVGRKTPSIGSFAKVWEGFQMPCNAVAMAFKRNQKKERTTTPVRTGRHARMFEGEPPKSNGRALLIGVGAVPADCPARARPGRCRSSPARGTYRA